VSAKAEKNPGTKNLQSGTTGQSDLTLIPTNNASNYLTKILNYEQK
jgi:hypothetical protein